MNISRYGVQSWPIKASIYSGLKPTRRDYCQFIIATLLNYAQTY